MHVESRSVLKIVLFVNRVEQQRMESSGSTALGISSPVRVAASPSRTIPYSLSREGRLTVLRHLKTIESPYCRLRYDLCCLAVVLPCVIVLWWVRLLDNIEVSCGEIIDALYDSVGLSEEREDFRAQLAVIRALDGKEADNCVTLDLSSMQLTRLNRHTMLHLVRLQSLDLSNNDLDDIAILKSGIEMLPLVQINLQNNKVCDSC